jgi:hypothetical protein
MGNGSLSWKLTVLLPIFSRFIFPTVALYFTVTLLVAHTRPSFADVSVSGSKFSYNVTIENTITKNDALIMAQHERDFELGLTVYLNSSGGDVDAAMQIGREIRRLDGTAWVVSYAKCYSSCALIYIAGVFRHSVGGEIGLHRPYFASRLQNRESIERSFPLMLQTVKTYVQEMGVSDNFYQEMVNTEPSSVRVFKGEDIKNLVPEHDPAYDEVLTSWNARRFGIDTTETRRRFKEKILCSSKKVDPGTAVDSDACEAILWGLSKSVYKDHWKRAAVCNLSNEEVHTLNLIRQRERRDHPLWMKKESCIRDIMLGR